MKSVFNLARRGIPGTRNFGIAMALLILQSLLIGGSTAQQNEASLAYVSSNADAIMISRPAQMMASRDFQNFRRVGGVAVDKTLENMTDNYFKMCGVEMKEIDQVIYASSVPDRNNFDPDQFYQATIIRTKQDNMVRFDMVTQLVKNEVEYKGKQYFELEQPVNYQQFAFIADEKTIVWGAKSTIEMTIDAGKEGIATTDWYKLWKKHHGEKDVSLVVSANGLKQIPFPPQFASVNNARLIVGGANIGNKTSGSAHAVCNSSLDAQKIVEAGNAALKLATQSLEAFEADNRDPKYDGSLKMAKRAIDATKFAVEGKIAVAKTEIEVDFADFLPLITSSRNAAARSTSANNIRQIAIAMHNYHDATKSFPPAVLTHESGKKYSWRIAVLPYMEQRALYDAYDFTQDWNSPHNAEVTANMPEFYRAGDEPSDSTNACYFMVTGDGTAAGGDAGLRLEDIVNWDGLSNTILAVESKQNIHWAEPRDIPFEKSRFGSFGGFFDGGFNAAFCDASVRFLSDKLSVDDLYGMLTVNGGEDVSPNKID